jgi:GT2 family glycosyltransferase
MSHPIDLSVVVSTFQRRDALRRTIESLLCQRFCTGVAYEIVIVDNNCTDGTRELVAEFVAQHPDRVRYVTERRQGVSHGRNAGIRAARGQVIAFTDDDNIVTPGWVATIVRLLRERPDVVGVGGRVLPEWPAPPPAWLDRRHWSPLAILDYGERPFRTSARKPLCLLTANLAFRRSALLAVDGFSPAFARCQDHELLIRLWRAGERVLYSPELIVVAPVSEERLTRGYHRRWHARHGRYAAAMQLEEAIDVDGTLRSSAPDTMRLCGSPGHVYADLGRQLTRGVAALVRRQWPIAAHHEHRVRYLAAYIWRRRALTDGERRSVAAELMSFVGEHVRRRARTVNMSARRLMGVHALLVLLIGGSAYDIVTGREHWPFSPYPMFSTIDTSPSLHTLVLRGVTNDPAPREIALRDPAFIAPFDQCRIITALSRVTSMGDQPRLHAMLGDSLERYDAARQAGAVQTPALTAVRLYDATWALQSDAANREQPDSVQLVDEFRAADR